MLWQVFYVKIFLYGLIGTRVIHISLVILIKISEVVYVTLIISDNFKEKVLILFYLFPQI